MVEIQWTYSIINECEHPIKAHRAKIMKCHKVRSLYPYPELLLIFSQLGHYTRKKLTPINSVFFCNNSVRPSRRRMVKTRAHPILTSSKRQRVDKISRLVAVIRSSLPNTILLISLSHATSHPSSAHFRASSPCGLVPAKVLSCFQVR